jgi:hypothetical protein
MTADELIAEGRKLDKPCLLLRPQGSGPVVAVWYEHDRNEVGAIGHRAWLTVDARQIPGLPASMTGYLSIFTDLELRKGGWVEESASWPQRAGTPLYAQAASVLPPSDAVLARSPAAAQWAASQGADRSSQEVATAVEKYEDVWMQEFPLYLSDDIYAVRGGWHMAWPEGDWHDLLDEQLMVLTLRNSELWVEAWRLRSGEYRVIQRIT